MNVHALPEGHQGFATARRILRSPEHQDRETLTAACDVLAFSRDWLDICLVREVRNAMWADKASDMLPSHVPFADYAKQPAHFGATLEAMNADTIRADRRRARLVLIAMALGMAAVMAGAIAAKAHAIHTAAIEQGAMQ